MKTPILSTAIAVVVGLTILGVVTMPQPTKEPKQIVNPRAWMVAQAYRTAATPAELEDYQNDAKDKLAKLDESTRFLEHLLAMEKRYPELASDKAGEHFRDVMQTAREFQRQIPEWKAAIQPAANGDFSDQAADRRDGAVAAWTVQWQILRRKTAETPKADEPLGMTMKGYDALKMGMHWMEVNLILGCNGIEQSRAGSLTVYVWKKGFAQIVASFENDKLVAKTQVGL